MAERDKRKMMNTARHKKPSSRSASKDRLMLMNQDRAQDPTEEQFYDAQDGDSCLLAKGNDRGRPRPKKDHSRIVAPVLMHQLPKVI